MSELERQVEFHPAWDKRSENPFEDKGIGGVNIQFTCKGATGAVSLTLMTDWFLPQVQEENRGRWGNVYGPRCVVISPVPWLVVHHDAPNDPEAQACPYTASQKCTADITYTGGDPFRDVLLSEGSAGLWRDLEKYYQERLEEGLQQ